jgi:CheY-like chemotaxis protein
MAMAEENPTVLLIEVTDVQIPGAMDGLDLVQLLHKTLPHIRVLVTSGRSGPQEAGACGATSFLPKPCTANDIQNVLGAFAPA